MSTLSPRGHRLAGQPLRPDFDAFDRAMSDLYHPDDNPDGYLTLCIAENLLNWEEMRNRLEAPLRRGHFPEWVASYAPMLGHEATRSAIAGFVERHIAHRSIDPERLALSAGATATVELTAMLVGDRDDVAVFPAPAYQVYSHDIGAKAGMRQDFLHGPLTPAALDAKRAEHGNRFRLLVLTHPNNPTGEIYPENTLREVGNWCHTHGVHLAVNEIYALSRFLGQEDDPPYRSFLPLLEELNSPYLHWWYSFSKDFGISGLRVGALYTRNEELLKGMAALNAPHQVSNTTQYLLADLLNDDAFVTDFQRKNRELITRAYTSVTDLCGKHGIPVSEARGSLFVWMDLRQFLRAGPRGQGGKDAQQLWQDIFDRTRVLLTAPQGFGTWEEGWFRLVYSCVSPAGLREALRRLDGYFSDQGQL